MESELQKEGAKTQVLQRPRTVFDRGYSAFGVDVFGVTYEVLLAKKPRWSKRWRRATRKEKKKDIMTEEGNSEWNQVLSAEARVSAPLEKLAKVLTMSSDTEEDPVALEKVVERVVEGIKGEATA